jgi:hypothetical protein
MYEAFYQLREKSFAILPDPGCLYFGERHTLASTVLVCGVVHGAGFTVNTGVVGCGKTTPMRHLLNRMVRDVMHLAPLASALFDMGALGHLERARHQDRSWAAHYDPPTFLGGRLRSPAPRPGVQASPIENPAEGIADRRVFQPGHQTELPTQIAARRHTLPRRAAA